MTAKRKQQQENEQEASAEVISAEAGAEELPGEDGIDCLRIAAELQLRRYAGKIALALGKKAACGDLNSAKFLLAITKEKPRPGRSRRRDGPSEAQRLAAEPPWQEPPPDSSADPPTEFDADGTDLAS
jgi:hypothetical protein